MKLKGTVLEMERKGAVFNAILNVAFIPDSEADTAHMISAGTGDDMELPESDVSPSEGYALNERWRN